MPAPRKIAIVGPTHPYSGGIATSTTTLANRLTRAGHSVELVSWKAQYPKFLRDVTRVPDDEPEVEPAAHVRYPLAWYDPFSWLRVGRALRKADVVIVTAVTPYHAVPFLAMRAAFGKGPAAIVIAHNVLPHEAGPVDRILTRALYRGFGRVLTHSASQKQLALSIVDDIDVAEVRLPIADFLFSDGVSVPSLQEDPIVRSGRRDPSALTLGFFGTIREYKGVDVLLRAMAGVPDVRLVVAGEFWQSIDEYRSLIAELGLADRVEIIDGYIPFSDLPAILGRVDVLALPYRSGTATFNVYLGFLFGLPALATRAATMALDVADGVDGVLADPDDVASLRGALERLLEPGVLETLQKGVDPATQARFWDDYVAAVEGLA